MVPVGRNPRLRMHLLARFGFMEREASAVVRRLLVQAPGRKAMNVRKGMNHKQGLHVRTRVRAGRLSANHNQGLRVRTKVRAGGLTRNHNEGLLSSRRVANAVGV